MLRAECQSAWMSKIANDSLTRSVWHRMLYSCTHKATVGVKGLIGSCYKPVAVSLAAAVVLSRQSTARLHWRLLSVTWQM